MRKDIFTIVMSLLFASQIASAQSKLKSDTKIATNKKVAVMKATVAIPFTLTQLQELCVMSVEDWNKKDVKNIKLKYEFQKDIDSIVIIIYDYNVFKEYLKQMNLTTNMNYRIVGKFIYIQSSTDEDGESFFDENNRMYFRIGVFKQ